MSNPYGELSLAQAKERQSNALKNVVRNSPGATVPGNVENFSRFYPTATKAILGVGDAFASAGATAGRTFDEAFSMPRDPGAGAYVKPKKSAPAVKAAAEPLAAPAVKAAAEPLAAPSLELTRNPVSSPNYHQDNVAMSDAEFEKLPTELRTLSSKPEISSDPPEMALAKTNRMGFNKETMDRANANIEFLKNNSQKVRYGNTAADFTKGPDGELMISGTGRGADTKYGKIEADVQKDRDVNASRMDAMYARMDTADQIEQNSPARVAEAAMSMAKKAGLDKTRTAALASQLAVPLSQTAQSVNQRMGNKYLAESGEKSVDVKAASDEKVAGIKSASDEKVAFGKDYGAGLKHLNSIKAEKFAIDKKYAEQQIEHAGNPEELEKARSLWRSGRAKNKENTDDYTIFLELYKKHGASL